MAQFVNQQPGAERGLVHCGGYLQRWLTDYGEAESPITHPLAAQVVFLKPRYEGLAHSGSLIKCC